ncbi:hypothetical protein AAVH_41616, partial [Aphelenchoides avenae]
DYVALREGCADKKLVSVCLSWEERDDEPAPLRSSFACQRCAIRVFDMTARLSLEVHRVFQCEVHSFVNKKQQKQMEAFK